MLICRAFQASPARVVHAGTRVMHWWLLALMNLRQICSLCSDSLLSPIVFSRVTPPSQPFVVLLFLHPHTIHCPALDVHICIRPASDPYYFFIISWRRDLHGDACQSGLSS